MKPYWSAATNASALEELLGCLNDRPAGLADEVPVALGGEVVGRRAMAEMGMDDDTEPLELLEVAIDGRQVHIGRESLHLGCEVLGRVMGAVGEQATKQ